MAFAVSPSITINEIDVSAYVPGVSTTEAAIGGVFTWGPAETRELISTEDELVSRFGRPNDDNYETFMIAANFLAYSNALYVSRAIDANTINAQAYDGMAPTGIQIKNEDDFIEKQSAIGAVTNFVAKYPGEIGNSLTISVCTSADAYESTITSDTANAEFTVAAFASQGQISVQDPTGNTTAAMAEATNIVDGIAVGDFIHITTNIGNVNLKVASIGAPQLDGNTAVATVTFVNSNNSESYTSDSITRRWEYYNRVNRAPGTSTFTAGRGGVGDELHIVVIDRQGDITGTPGTILEVWDSLSRATNGKNENGAKNYYKDVLNETSLFVWAANDIAGVTSAEAANITSIATPVYTTNFMGGATGATESTVELADLIRAYDNFKSEEALPDLSIIIAGKAIGGTHGEGIANYIIDNIAEVRKGCVVTISPAMDDVVGAPYQEVQNLVEFRNALTSTSRGILTSSYKYQYDKYSGKTRWVAGCGDDAGLIARTDHERDPWWSPAGQTRGQYKNIIKLAFNPDRADRDVLYRADINPVITRAGAGTHLFGDKTLLGKPSAFDRINVRRLFDTLERAIGRASVDLLFEMNNVQTRARFRNMVEPFLRDVMGRGGITRFKVVCDESNNTPSVIDRNEFVGSILVVPAKSINFITLNFYAVANTLEFDYVIGQAV